MLYSFPQFSPRMRWAGHRPAWKGIARLQGAKRPRVWRTRGGSALLRENAAIAGTISVMVWAIFIWLAVVIALVVVVLRLARGESHQGASYEPVDDLLDAEQQSQQARSPRVAGTAPSFQPTGHPRPEYRGDDTLDSTMENPVYVNNASVVEVRALFKSGERRDDKQSATELKAPSSANDSDAIHPLKPLG